MNTTTLPAIIITNQCVDTLTQFLSKHTEERDNTPGIILGVTLVMLVAVNAAVGVWRMLNKVNVKKVENGTDIENGTGVEQK